MRSLQILSLLLWSITELAPIHILSNSTKNMDINNKVAIVTGAIRGIGYVTVQHFLRRGAKFVAIFDLDEKEHEEVTNAFKQLEQEFDKQRFGYFSCDVATFKQFVACYDEVYTTNGAVDILVNNAGVFEEHDPDLAIAVNLTSVIHCTMHAIERMGIHKGGKGGVEGGVIVNIGSICALKSLPTIPVYSATKGAVVCFVRSMKDHNERLGVRIVCLCPGMTKTKMTDISGDSKKYLLHFVPQEMADHHLSMYLQDPNSVASAIVEIAEKGKAGDVWLQFCDQPPIDWENKKAVEQYFKLFK